MGWLETYATLVVFRIVIELITTKVLGMEGLDIFPEFGDFPTPMF